MLAEVQGQVEIDTHYFFTQTIIFESVTTTQLQVDGTVVVNDIDLTDSEWVPIGSSPPREFNGAFDGSYHVISNPCTTFPDGLECSGRPLFGRR
jgi:hypothetical protein